MRTPERSVEITQVTEWEDGGTRSIQDSLAAEEPLEIRIGYTPLTVTMRTPGNDMELAAGFLLTEWIIESADQILEIRLVPGQGEGKSNVVEVDLRDCQFDSRDVRRNFFAASSCGICGKASIEMVRRRGLVQPDRAFRIDPEVMCRLPDTLRSEQAGFCTGSESFWPAFRRISSGGCISATGSSEASDWDSAISFQLRCW